MYRPSSPIEAPRCFSASDIEALARVKFVIGECIARGLVPTDKQIEALDFGAGYGTPTWGLRLLLPENSNINAVEEDPAKAERIISRGILPAHQVTACDGFKLLASNRYDLITMFSPWPDPSGDFMTEFLKASSSSVNKEGSVIVNTSYNTTNATIRACGEIGLDFMHIEPTLIKDGPRPIDTYDTIVIQPR